MEYASFFSSATFFFLFSCLQWSCDSQYGPADYERCAPFACGNINVTFPFYSSEKTGDNPRCGIPGLELSCNPPSQALTFDAKGKYYQVKQIYPSDRAITLNDSNLFEKLQHGICGGVEYFNATVPDSLGLVSSSANLTLLRCDRGHNFPTSSQKKVLNYTDCKENNLFVPNYSNFFDLNNNSADIGCIGIEGSDACDCFSVPVLVASRAKLADATKSNALNGSDLLDVLSRGFILQWPNDMKWWKCQNCQSLGERCGYDDNLKEVVCLPRFEQKNSKHSKRWKVILGVASAAAMLLIALGALLVLKFRTKASYIFKKDYFKSKRSRDDDRNVQMFIKSYQSSLVNKYSYYEIQKMTNNFKHKIGEGGYGNVYRGKLSDGRLIAAKMLEKSRSSGQDFINEVSTIGLIHHVNVIRLLGFCFDGSKRALIYEFMHNGSLGDLIFNENSGRHLGGPKLLEIAIGVARGIEYLHQGCDTRILHLDIKPHNVLLDHNYNPKISDFGLAKSYSRKHSAVPLTDARGTIGYIAPEVFLRNLGGVSHKSDVYSYGMLLLEMVGGRKNAERETENSSKQYFPDWIYDQVSREGGMDIIDSIVEEDMIVARKVVMVGLWCIQMNPAERPSMSGALEMLTGSLEAISMPPKPFLFSPPRPSPQHDIFDPSSDTEDMPFYSLSN